MQESVFNLSLFKIPTAVAEGTCKKGKEEGREGRKEGKEEKEN